MLCDDDEYPRLRECSSSDWGRNTLRRRALVAGAVVASALIAQQNEVLAPNTATASPTLVAGTLDFEESSGWTQQSSHVPQRRRRLQANAVPASGTGGGVAGLGSVSVNYVWSYGLGAPTCPFSACQALSDNRPSRRRWKGRVSICTCAGSPVRRPGTRAERATELHDYGRYRCFPISIRERHGRALTERRRRRRGRGLSRPPESSST